MTKGPQLMGLGNIDNVPSPQNLWKNEKNRYRHWMILFGIGFLVVLALYLTATIMNIFDRNNIIGIWTNIFGKVIPKPSPQEIEVAANNKFRVDYLVLPSITSSLILVGLVLYVVTIIQSYQVKSFAKISSWSIYVIGIGAFLSGIQLVMMIFNITSFLQTGGAIFQFINFFVIIAIWFICGSKVNRIRKQFSFSEYVERLRKDEKFLQWQSQMQNTMQNMTYPQNESFSSQTPIAKTSHAKKESVPTTSKTTNTSHHKGLQVSKLRAMSLEKIHEIAKKLSIFDYQTMKKEDLVQTITRIINSQQNPNK